MKAPSQRLNTGIKVPLDKIEHEFLALWQASAQDTQTALMRSSTLTLMIFTALKSRFLKIRSMMNKIGTHHPSRIIIIFIDPHSASRDISAAISSFCQMPQNDRQQICHELVILKTGKNGVAHLPGTLLTLRLPDLPVFTWLDQPELLQNADLESFYSGSDRLITNLKDATTESIKKHIDHILQLENIGTSDFSWLHLTAWRDAIARFFDDASTAPHLSTNILEVRIEHSNRERLWSPLLLIGWMASRLKWQIAEQSREHYVFRKINDGLVTVTLQPGTSVHANQEINAIYIQTVFMDEIILLEAIAKKNGRIALQIKKGNRTFCKQHILVPHSDDAHCLCEELDSLLTDRVFMESIRMLQKLLAHGRRGSR